MKKSLTRVLSLVLVLVMMLGVMPVVSADTVQAKAFTVTPTEVSLNLTDNKTATIEIATFTSSGNANLLTAGGLIETSYSGYDTTVISVSDSGEITALKAGTTSITVSATASKEGEWSNVHTGTATVSVTVGGTAVTGVLVDPTAKSLKIGETQQLTATVAPEGASNKNVTWSSNKETVATVSESGLVTAVGEGTATITATTVDGSKTATCMVTVTSAYTLTATLSKSTLYVGDTATLTIKATKEGASTFPEEELVVGITEGEGTVIDWVSGQTGKKIEAKGVGTAKIKVVAGVASGDHKEVELTVTVAGGNIVCANMEIAASTGQVDLATKVKFYNDGATSGTSDNDEVNFIYELAQSIGDVTLEADGDLECDGPGAAAVTITAVAKDTETVLDTHTVYVSFYVSNYPKVTMPAGSVELEFDKNADTEEAGALVTAILEDYADSDAYNGFHDFKFSGLYASEGTLSYSGTGNSCVVTDVEDMVFRVGTYGTADFEFKVTAENFAGLSLVQGTVTINYDGKLSSIEYSTTYDKSVTFKESDFTKFWASAEMDGDLDYVTFNLTSYTGTLYTKSGTTSSSYLALDTHKFYVGTVPSGSSSKDLGAVTYVPVKTKTSTYDVEIPFNAVGEKAGEEISGRVIIHMNEKGNEITSRGIYFSTVYDKNNTTTTADDKTYADQIADIYYTASGKDLGYVVFKTPAVEECRLYKSIPASAAVAKGTQLPYNTKLYYGTSSNPKLTSAALVPAAGYKGKITLYFTAYDVNGGNAKDCAISFEVKTKTASAVFSDVNAKNYSWAADSVDFLYYEGTAQGSNGKYNPAANITRQDFMLMLYRAFLAEDYGTFTPSSNFPDVPVGTTAYAKEIYQAVGVAKYLGIAQGTNNKFNPKSNITRQEAMVLIYRTLDTINRDLEYTSSVKLTSMKDYSKISSWAVTAISNLVSHGVIQGTNDYIKPAANITRAEMAAILHRVITY